jgi:hypothetical protein
MPRGRAAAGRRGDDVHMTVELRFAEAVVGSLPGAVDTLLSVSGLWRGGRLPGPVRSLPGAACAARRCARSASRRAWTLAPRSCDREGHAAFGAPAVILCEHARPRASLPCEGDSVHGEIHQHLEACAGADHRPPRREAVLVVPRDRTGQVFRCGVRTAAARDEERGPLRHGPAEIPGARPGSNEMVRDIDGALHVAAD